MPGNQILDWRIFVRKYRYIYKPNSPAKGSGKRAKDIHSRSDPSRKSIVAIPGLIEFGGLFSKDCEDSIGGIAGLKPGKEGMLGKILLSLTVVFFQSDVENGGKVGMGGRRGRDGRHGVTGLRKREGKEYLVMRD
jgi:hypothetical protein